MKIFKNVMIVLFSYIVFFCNLPKVDALFDLNVNQATYDSNTGILTIYSSDFSNNDYNTNYIANLSEIRLGNTTLIGTYEFKPGMLKIYIRNKDIINKQNNFIINNTIQSGLLLLNGAIVIEKKPPNSINVVLVNQSNEITLNVNTIGLKPKMSIDSFSSNITTLNSDGGEIILTVRGNNLEQGNFQIRSLNSSVKYDLNISSTIATARINCVANGMNTNRIDTFILYLNGVETNKQVSVTIGPEKENVTNTNPSNPSNSNNSNKPNNSDKSNSSNNSNNSDKPNSSNNSNNSDKPNSSNDINSPDEDSISNNNEVFNSIEQSEIKKNKDDQKKNKSTNIVLLTTIPLLGAVISIIIVMRKKKKL